MTCCNFCWYTYSWNTVGSLHYLPNNILCISGMALYCTADNPTYNFLNEYYSLSNIIHKYYHGKIFFMIIWLHVANYYCYLLIIIIIHFSFFFFYFRKIPLLESYILMYSECASFSAPAIDKKQCTRVLHLIKYFLYRH